MNRTELLSKKQTWWILFGGSAIASFFTLAASRDVFLDFSHHAQFSELLSKGTYYPPHFLYHGLSILVNRITTLSLIHSGFLIIWVSLVLSFFVSFWFLSNGNKAVPSAVTTLFSISLFLFHPIPIAFLTDKHLYYGYVTPNVFHNPTILLLKPLALAHFLLALIFLKKPNVSKVQMVALTFLTAATVLAKPSYIFSFLPSAFILVTWSLFSASRTQKLNLKVFWFGIFIPATALLVGQFINRYLGGAGERMAFEPLALFRLTSHPHTFLPKLISSLAFPLSIIFIFFDQIKSRLDFQLSALNLLISLIYNYCLVEKGPALSHGNFSWSSQISLFILILVCLRFLIVQIKLVLLEKQITDQVRWGITTAIMILGAHFLSGSVWFFTNLIQGGFRP